MSAQLKDIASLGPEKLFGAGSPRLAASIRPDSPVLVVLAAGKGTRFGKDPKCIQLVHGTPLARHSIDSFRRLSPAPSICLIGYRHAEVAAALGADNIFVQSANPAGGTAFAAYEAFSVPELAARNPLLVVTMGDRVVPPVIFRRLLEAHAAGPREADLTFLTAVYEPPKNRGKGRILRDDAGRVERIVEERDILAESAGAARDARLALIEGNCPLYAIRAATLLRHLRTLSNANAQGQHYLTDIIETLNREGGEIRTITTSPADPEYDLLCCDVTQPMDLALLEGTLSSARGLLFPDDEDLDRAAAAIRADRPAAQVASIARQLGEMLAAESLEKLGFAPDQPVAIGICGGRLRIAFMHPDMVRFFGPAWQMPIGAGSAAGEEQIVILMQAAEDRRLHLYPLNPKYRESLNALPSDDDRLYPGDDVADTNAYEEFGTRMSESLLLSLGYFSDDELAARRAKSQPLPPPSLWVANNMRRPFALVKNAIASMRTLRTGNLGARVQRRLGQDAFRGLRMISTGSIPQGGFSSSSAVTVATQNAVNALWDLGLPPDMLVHLACQAEYGTGVRAGSLDQATEQKGRAGQGTLISSNPRENYRIIGAYPAPGRFQIVFPYTVERDRAAWRWSWGAYAESPSANGALTTGETRKMTGKAAELAALLTRLPLDTDFFPRVEHDLVTTGELSPDSRRWVRDVLRQLPLAARRAELREAALANREWLVERLMEHEAHDRAAAERKASATVDSIFAGWRDPRAGVPLRAMVAYLFGETAKNFYLIHHPDQWIEYVTRSQAGDRCFDIDPHRLPDRVSMESELEWERAAAGADRMNLWLDRFGATPFDFNAGLDDGSLAGADPPEFHRLAGSNFFRGLALVDLAEAMLKRAFGGGAIAVRVNAAGQGDYFQVHVDTEKAEPAAVKAFLRTAFYRRFGIAPDPEFVDIHSGGGAAGVRLARFDSLTRLAGMLGPR